MNNKSRFVYGSSFVILLIAEILIGLYVHDNFVRPYIGDVLVTILLCCLCRTVFPKGIKALPIYVCIFATLVEIAQYLQIVKILGVENNSFLSTIIGTSFSPVDLICYSVGCMIFWAFERFLNRKKVNTTQVVNEVENIVYAWCKPFGFQKHGRTLHRFVDRDLSQVINFQNGCPEKQVYGILWINIGIRVPECAHFPGEHKAYYKEYDCNIRCRLDEYIEGEEKPYRLSDDPERIAADIIMKLEKSIMPVFDILSTRQSIIENLRNYPDFNALRNHLVERDISTIINYLNQIESNP